MMISITLYCLQLLTLALNTFNNLLLFFFFPFFFRDESQFLSIKTAHLVWNDVLVAMVTLLPT